jgi:trans-2,3-dihydro-3-hydroxyanthranilate isomerase
MSRRFVTLDVFTGERFAGNPLAVVLDAEGLDTAAMQQIAKEFNLSETVFVLPPSEPRQRADIRIFTPARELPFAGHPTVGTAVLLALLDQNGEPGAAAFGLKEQVGIVPCAVEVRDATNGTARFRLPRLPFVWGEGKESTDCGWALGLGPTEIGFDQHVPSRHSAGVAFDFVPVSSAEVLARAKPQGENFNTVFGDSDHPATYVYTRLASANGLRFRARMFGPGMGIAEDPATGGAAAAFTGALMQCEPLGDGEHNIVIEQGVEMGRPSEIILQMVIKDGALASAEIGGGAVMVSRGEILA